MSGLREIAAEELSERLRSGAPTVLVDVRQPWEYEICHIPGSVLAPMEELWDFDELEVADDALVVVICHHGVRSLGGAVTLLRRGLPNVASLAGGIDAWSRRIDPSMPRY